MERCILGSSRDGAWINVKKNKGVTEVMTLPNVLSLVSDCISVPFLIMAKSP